MHETSFQTYTCAHPNLQQLPERFVTNKKSFLLSLILLSTIEMLKTPLNNINANSNRHFEHRKACKQGETVFLTEADKQ